MSEWKSIDSLIKSDTDLSEYLYSYDFACRIGLIPESDVEARSARIQVRSCLRRI